MAELHRRPRAHQDNSPLMQGASPTADLAMMAIRDAVRKSGVPTSHETVRQMLLRPAPEAAP